MTTTTHAAAQTGRDPIIRISWLLCWALISIVLVWSMKDRLADLDFRDPDDSLRLVEVRAWLAGQSWFDVTQYRVNPPLGGAMHWWRPLDVPIGLGIMALRPLLGQPMAEVVWLSLYPLLLLGLLLYLIGRVGLHLGSAALAAMAMAYMGTQFYAIHQFAPLRIDHHGWQIILAIILLLLSLHPPTNRRMLLFGTVLAAYLCLSLEALPYAVLFTAIPVFAYLRKPDQVAPLAIAIGSTAVMAVLLTLATRGLDPFLYTACDALTLPYLAALVTAAIMLPILHAFLPAGWRWRLGILALMGAAALGVGLLAAPQCSGGPFGQLDPIVYQLWYLSVPEGRPVLNQSLLTSLIALLPSGMAIIGCITAWLAARDAAARRNWAIMLWLTVGSMLVTLSVTRASYIATVFASLGGAFLFLAVLRRARAVRYMAARVVLTAMTIVLIPIIPAAIIGAAIDDEADQADAAVKATPESCRSASTMAPLRQLPKSLLFAPIDLGPAILANTDHAVIATGHHRSNLAMKRTIEGFTGVPGTARAAIIGSTADYLVYCPKESELVRYRAHRKTNLVERLERGQTPGWLTPLRIPLDDGYRIYRIVRPTAATAATASPTGPN